MALSDLHDFLSAGLAAADIAASCVVTVQETSGPPYAPIITDVAHDCSGWVDEYSAAERANGDVLVSDRKVYVLVDSLDVTPTTSNTVTIDGSTYSIITVERDPASVAWVLQCRT